MTKIQFKTIALRVLVGSYRGLGYVGKYVTVFFSHLLRFIRELLRWVLPVALFFYRIIFWFKRRLSALTAPVRSTVVAFMTHRHTIHFAMLSIATATAIFSFGSRVARAEDLGTKSLLYTLVSGASDEFIDEGAPAEIESFPAEYLVDVVAVGRVPAIDFDFIGEGYVSTITGAGAVEATRLESGSRGAARTSMVTYTVSEGDTVSRIADDFGLSIETVLWANKLTVRSYIRPGDVLAIPPIDGVLHTVKKGDTVQKLAQYYRTEATDIISWNKLGESAALSLGESLMIPGGTVPAPPVRRVSPPSTLFTGVRPADAANVPAGDKMLWPTAATKVTQYFGWRHTGLDIGGPTGTAIYAAADGIVEYSGWSRGYGNNVVVNHGNGTKTRYAHNSKHFVSKGDQVTKGQTITAMGSTGRSTGPHVHFEVMVNGVFKNPLSYIR